MLQKNTNSVEAHVLKKYRIIQKVGQGAYGHVWKVEQKITKQVYALKKIFDAFQHATDAQRTYRQVTILKQMDHPNIIKLHETLRAQNNRDLYMIMQYMEADLHQVIMEGILKDVHRKYIIYQIAKTLKYLHSACLLHRDLKPSNVLINSNCSIKICDFGLVRCVENEDNQQILTEGVATRWYRAPQVLLGIKNYSGPADVWSFGCVIYELFVGKPLFTGTSNLDQLQKIIQFTGYPTQEEINSNSEIGKVMLGNLSKYNKRQVKDLIPNVPIQIVQLIKNILKFNPADRITLSQILGLPMFEPFRNPEEELVSSKPIKTTIDDNRQQSVQHYRSAVYGVKRHSLQRTKEPKIQQKQNTSKKSLQQKCEPTENKTQNKDNEPNIHEPVIKYIKSTGNLAKQQKPLDKPNPLAQKSQKTLKMLAEESKFKKYNYNSSNLTKALAKTSLKPTNIKQSSIGFLRKKKLGENGEKVQT